MPSYQKVFKREKKKPSWKANCLIGVWEKIYMGINMLESSGWKPELGMR